jgi:nucleotide-binding universal stress UspA family protein
LKAILVAVDFSEVSGRVVERAAQLAEASNSALCLLHVGPPEADMFGAQLVRKVVSPDEVPDSLRKAHAQLAQLVEELRGRGLRIESSLVRGKAVESILEEASLRDVELIALGSHGHSPLYRAIVGSVSEGVLRGTKHPVLIIPSEGGSRGH